MGLVDDLADSGPKPDDRPPKEFRPRSDIDSVAGGYVVSKPFTPDTDPDHSAILEDFELDPAKWRITSYRTARWQTYDERWLHSLRLNVEPVTAVQRAVVDAERVVKQISSWRPRRPKHVNYETTFHVPIGDTQIGKIDGGGTPATIDRFLNQLGHTVDRQRNLKAATVHLPWLGDCIEGLVSQGGKVAGRLDVTLTEQVRILRRLAMAQIKAFAPHTANIVITTVPGNHDETTRAILTKGDDSWAVDAMSAVRDGIKENPELCDRVRFVFPHTDELTIVEQFGDTVIAMAHGHQFGNGTDGALKWWDGQAAGRTPVGDADLLLSAHKHHLVAKDHGGNRLWLQIPALDGGSQWYKERTGHNAPSRIVSFTTSAGRIRNLDPIL